MFGSVCNSCWSETGTTYHIDENKNKDKNKTIGINSCTKRKENISLLALDCCWLLPPKKKTFVAGHTPLV